MRVCTRCKTGKHRSHFYSIGKRLHSWCKGCFNGYLIDKAKARKAEVIEQKGGGCVDCGLTYDGTNTVVFDLHHTTGTDDKVGDWKAMRLMSGDRLKRELKKCVLLCANCHRLRHARGVPNIRTGRYRKLTNRKPNAD